MRVTVVGALAIAAVVIAVALLIAYWGRAKGQGPEPNYV